MGILSEKIPSIKMDEKSALVFGNAICCPSVTFRQTGEKPICFDNTFSVNLDWAMWLKLAEKPGAFVYIPEMMMAHRIAESMETAGGRRLLCDAE